MENELVRLVDALPGFVWTADSDGELDFLNRRWLDFVGLSLEQARGSGWQVAIHLDDMDHLLAHFRACLASGEPVNCEGRMRRSDGVYRWFLLLANPLREETGKIVRWFGTNIDIEDRKRAEEAVRASEQDRKRSDEALHANERELRLIINTLPTLAWSSLPDGFCDFLNQRWLDYAGMSAEQALGWGWAAALHPDDAKGMQEEWGYSLATGTPTDTQARLRRFDGSYRWFLFRDNPLRDENGKIVKWYGMAVDIDDRKRAEEELRRSEVLLAEGQLVSQTGSFYWSVDSDEIRASGEFYRIFELEQGSSATFAAIAARVHSEDLPLVNERLARARSGVPDLDCEFRLRLPNGSLKCLRMTLNATRERGTGLEYVGAIQDITERRLSEAVLANVRSELAYMTRVASMGTLAASIAHEVNQPLSGIVTNATTCLRMLSAEPPNVAGALETARRSIRDGHRATDVIARLRSLFTKKSTAREPVDLNEAAREVVALSLNELERNGVTVRAELTSDLPVISGDRIQLQQVILNLLTNASAAMSEIEDRPRRLLIRTEQDSGKCIRLSVQDVGVGIRDADKDKLFEAFYTTKANGMGIGLSVSRSIIENHDGNLWATPNDGPGATFSFSIPQRSS
ncbi:MAG: PAS domain-containing protein [Myxococcales bacterium]